MLKIAICDDEEVFLEDTLKCCKRYFEKKGIDCDISTFSDGNELIDSGQYDIALLDVEMPGMSGIDIKKYLERQRYNTRIVFISGYPDMMQEAFGDRVSGFLVKPVNEMDFGKKMDEVLEKIIHAGRLMVCDTEYGNKAFYIDEILYIRAEGRYSRIYKEDGSTVLVSKSISEYEKEENEKLVRCHKSFVINFEHVKSIKAVVIMKNGTEIPIGRTLKDEVKEKYDRYILWRM